MLRCRWFSIPAVRRLGAAAVLAVVVGSSTLSDARAETPDDIGAPQMSSFGTFGGIDYVKYRGVFEGETSTGGFRVPYQIIAPADPTEGNGTVLVEPSHFMIGL